MTKDNNHNPLFIIHQPAFTLAEVLITLGIIGVVAAMTIPNLIANQRNKALQTKLKKVYSELNQASKLYMEENETPLPIAFSTGQTTMDKFFSTYMKGWTTKTAVKHNTKDENGENMFSKTYKYTNFKGASVYQICDDSYSKSLINGVSFWHNNYPAEGVNGPILCLDLNGETTGPNISGIDYFLFIFTLDGTVIPMGMEHSDNTPSSECWSNSNPFFPKAHCNNGNNYSCAYWAILDKSPDGKGEYWKDFIGKKQYK